MTLTSRRLTVRWTRMRFHRPQFAVRKSTARGRVMDCGRRSGKTELAKRILVSHLLDKIPGCRKPRYVVAAPTQEQAVEIFWEDLLELIPGKWIAGGKKGPERLLFAIPDQAPQRCHSQRGRAGQTSADRRQVPATASWATNGATLKTPSLTKLSARCWPTIHGWFILCGVPKRQGIGARWFRNLCEKIAAGEYPDAEPLELAIMGYRRSKGNRGG